MSLERVTVDLIRTKYWDPIIKTGKLLQLYAIQDYDGRLVVKSPTITFIPDGSLLYINEEKNINYRYDDWLSYSSTDPYIESDQGKSLNDFYYLGGYMNGLVGVGFQKYDLQICTKPVNILSTDCMDAVDVWTTKENI